MRKKRKSLSLVLTVVLVIISMITVSLAVYANQDYPEENDVTLSPYFYIEDGDSSVDHLPLKATDVISNINGVIADTYVTQTYENQGNKPINARYIFPTSTKVSVHGMTMAIGDKIITAKIREREEAKQEFEQAKTEGKSASLLEQERPNVFTMSVANIMPGDTVKIELHYSELIIPTDGTYQFVFPTVVGPRYSREYSNSEDAENEFVNTPYLKDDKTLNGKYNITVNLNAGMPIKDLISSTHKINVVNNNDLSANVTLADTQEFAGNRDYILDYKLTGKSIQTGLILNSNDKENFFMLMVQPPERFETKEILPREYVFLLDVSGSMSGFPLETAKSLIRNLVTQLKETDTFNVILFSGDSMLMAPKSVPATEESINDAVEMIDSYYAGGGTELSFALETAMNIPKDEDKSRSVIVITDGYIAEEKETFDIIKQNIGNTNFFSFGIGDGVNRYLIEGIAKTGLGEAFVAANESEAEEVAGRFQTYIQSPLLSNVEIKYNGFDAYDVQPEQIPTLFAQRPVVIFGKYRGEPTGTIELTGKTGDKDYSQTISLSNIKPLENSALPFLWARTKVENISDYGFNTEDSESIKKQVTQLGLDYSMITPYTSFIAVTEEVRNKDGKSTDVIQPLPMPENVSELAVGNYTSGSEPGLFMAAIMGLSLLLISYKTKSKLKVG